MFEFLGRLLSEAASGVIFDFVDAIDDDTTICAYGKKLKIKEFDNPDEVKKLLHDMIDDWGVSILGQTTYDDVIGLCDKRVDEAFAKRGLVDARSEETVEIIPENVCCKEADACDDCINEHIVEDIRDYILGKAQEAGVTEIDDSILGKSVSVLYEYTMFLKERGKYTVC